MPAGFFPIRAATFPICGEEERQPENILTNFYSTHLKLFLLTGIEYSR
jgi:hypothetical protein